MLVGIYTNKSKDVGGIWSNKLHSLLNRYGIDYIDIFDGNFSAVNPMEHAPEKKPDLIVVLGGDGTILGLTTYAAENSVPVIGINAGKLGFLTEFETFEMESAVEMIKHGKLKADERILLQIEAGEKRYYALNDCVLQRLCSEENTGSLIVGLSVALDNTLVDKITGDGLIISTPTGSTAYSLSAGGPILAPGIESFCITPISAHSLHHRPIIYGTQSACVVAVEEGGLTGLFCDGKLICRLSAGDSVKVSRAARTINFLRKKDSNFYNRLLLKLNNGRE